LHQKKITKFTLYGFFLEFAVRVLLVFIIWYQKLLSISNIHLWSLNPSQ